MRSFFGLASYYSRFIEILGKIAAPLTKLIENNRPFVWDDYATNAFSELWTRLANSPILIYPDFRVPFLLDSDVSDKGIGAILSQLGKDHLEHSIAYFSSTLGKHERKNSITRKELLAAIEGIEQLRCYSNGHQFVLQSDYVVIQLLKTF